MGRSPCCDKANVKRGPWSPEEDATLRNYIEEHGAAGNWIALPRKAGLHRCGKSCRLRWLNYLRPDIKLGGFTEEEDNMIYSLYSTIGSRWSVIASKMPGRTDNDVKNHWNTKLKKKVLAGIVCLQNDTPPPATRNRKGLMIHNISRSSDGNQFESLSRGKRVSDFSNSPSNHHSITYLDEFPNFSASSSLEMDKGDSLWLGNWGVEELANLFDLQCGSLYDPFLHEFGSKDNMHH